MVWAELWALSTEHWTLSTEPRDTVALWKANVRAGHQGFGGRRLFRALDRRLPSRVITMGLFSRSAPQLWTEDEEREGGALCNIRTTSSHRVHRELGPPHAPWVGVGAQSGRGGCLPGAAGEILHRTQIIAVGVDCMDLLGGAHKTGICIPHAKPHCGSFNRHMWHLHGCVVLCGGITWHWWGHKRGLEPSWGGESHQVEARNYHQQFLPIIRPAPTSLCRL